MSKTVNLNVDLPAPFIPRAGEQFFYIDFSSTDNYGSQKYSYPYNYDVGLAWDSEEKILIVVAALETMRGSCDD